MRRRDAIRAGGSAVVVALAGCTSGSGDDDAGSGFDDVSSPWSREGEVYHPSHSIGMRMLDMVQSGSLTVGLASKYTERFWTVTGERTKRVGVEDEYNAIHLMVSVWDTETGTVLPVDTGLRVAVERDGERLTERAMWPMLSQRMGFHFGDNIQFPDQGSYTLVVDVGDTSVERIGDGDFGGSETLRLGYEFDRTTRNLVPVEKLLDRRGDADALQPMQMEGWPLSVAPSRSELPGTVLGSGRSDGAVFVVSTTETTDGPVVTVSPRTPYNRFVLPLMSLSLSVERRGTTVSDGRLSTAIGPERGYHYRTTLDGLESGDELTVSVDSPPQVARHVGYETAFLEMSDVTVTA
jgi:hypothetical protein